MPPVTQRIPDLLGGVSQQAAHRRRPNELESSLNALHSLAKGFGKRPGTRSIAQLSATPSDFVSPDVFFLDYGPDGRFYATFIDGDLMVWDQNGVEQVVAFPNGKGYLGAENGIPRTFMDEFTNANGTTLTAHDAQWILKSGTNAMTIQSNKANMNFLGSQYHFARVIPTADYTVSAIINYGGNSSLPGEVYARVNAAWTAGYKFALTATAGTATIQLSRINANGSLTGIASGTTATVGAADTTIAIRVTGTLIEALVNGVVVLSVTDATTSAAGFAGIGGDSAGTTVTANDFTVLYSEPNSETLRLIRTAVLGNRAFVANRTIKVERDTARKAPVQTPQALLYVEQADYATKYSVTIDGTPIEYETPAGADPSTRRAIATDAITTALVDALTAAFASFSFEQFGSMIRVSRTDAADFRITTKDGLADNGLRVIKGTVQRSADLPLRGVDGFTVEVVGDPEQARDNYWVEFDVQNADDFRGVWKEVARPGEAIALDPSTMPHELVFTDEVTQPEQARGFPSLPVVSAVEPTWHESVWATGLNDTGTVLTGVVQGDRILRLDGHGEEMFANIINANGGPVKVRVRYNINTVGMSEDETFLVKIDYNDGVASTSWTEGRTLAFAPGVFATDQFVDVDVPVLDANFDIRIRVEYSGGASPADWGGVYVFGDRHDGIRYQVFTARDVTWRTDTVYPKHTAWTVDVDGTPANYTQTTDLTGAEIAAALEPVVEALAGINSSVVTTSTGTAIRIVYASGIGIPDVEVSHTFSKLTYFWNPELEWQFTADSLAGKTLRNLSDGSEGTITSNYGFGATVGSLTGGVDNEFNDGDLCVVIDTVKKLTFREVMWTPRSAGDSVTNPWPSFRDNYIREVFYHRGRLGFLSGGNVIFSEAGKPENLYRTVTTSLIDSDPIDVAYAGGNNARFNSAVSWNGETVIFGDRVQVVPRGEPVFSPRSIRLDQLSAYPCDPQGKPEAAGRYVFFGRPTKDDTRTHVAALGISTRSRVAEARSLTTDLPTYLSGTPITFAADPLLNHVFVLADGDRTKLYHLTYQMEDDAPQAASWGTWEFEGEVMGLDVGNGTLAVLVNYSDGLYLETVDLNAEEPILLDRLVEGLDCSPVFSAGSTTWTLPYSVATDGSEGTVEVVQADGTVLVTTRPTATTVRAVGDYDADAVSIGLQFEYEAQLSTIYLRSADATGILKADTRKHLTVHKVRFLHEDTRKYDVLIQGSERSEVTYSFSEDDEDNGSFAAPVMSNNEHVTIKLRSTYPLPCWITGAEWDGTFRARTGLR